MESPYPIHWPCFYTATIQHWKPLLTDDRFKNIIVGSLQFLVKEKRIMLYAFVIMNYHVHLVWQALPPYDFSSIRLSFMKFTAQQIKRVLQNENPVLLNEYSSSHKADRSYQFWKGESLSTELFTPAVFYQKINYIHNNPCTCGIEYSSGRLSLFIC